MGCRRHISRQTTSLDSVFQSPLSIFQYFNFQSSIFLTPEEYFEFIAKVASISKEELTERTSAFEQFTGGEVFGRNALIRNLSAGNKQKVGIISALITRPKLLILDEPFNFLDPSSQNHLKHIIEEYRETTGATIIVSSHNLTHTIDISTRILLMEQGEIKRDINEITPDAVSALNDYFDHQ